MKKQNHVLNALFGVAVGDALGVPVEFMSRAKLKTKPVREMIGFGTHDMPVGTWSDDTSLTLCLADALCSDFSLDLIAEKFCAWFYRNLWTPVPAAGVFDFGGTTANAMERLQNGQNPETCGDIEEHSNGNGSLMRILPLVFHIIDKNTNERFLITKQVSSVTHGHIRSVIACFYYLEFARKIILGEEKFQIYEKLKSEVGDFLDSQSIDFEEIDIFDNLLDDNIFEFDEHEIASSGYVVDTLEAAVWCLLTTDSYSDCVLKAVNLGEDTDTTAAVAGGLAGLIYGFENIPQKWISVLARKYDIEKLAEKLNDKYISINELKM